MRKFARVAGCLVLGLVGTSVLSATLPSKPYQAVYDETSGTGGKTVHTFIFDGQGHGRMEIQRGSGKTDVSLVDIPKRRITILMSDTKTAMTMPLKDDDINSLAAFGAEVKATGTPLGTKVIDGHPCHGVRYDLGSGTEELWTGDDIGIRVYSKVQTRYGDTEAHLRSYVPQPPAADAFTVPAGYTEMASVPSAHP